MRGGEGKSVPGAEGAGKAFSLPGVAFSEGGGDHIQDLLFGIGPFRGEEEIAGDIADQALDGDVGGDTLEEAGGETGVLGGVERAELAAAVGVGDGGALGHVEVVELDALDGESR